MNIRSRDELSFFVLILVLLKEGKLAEIYLTDRRNENDLKDVAYTMGISKMFTGGELRKYAHNLCQTYLQYDKTSGTFSFVHQSIWDTLFVYMCETDLNRALKVCTAQQAVWYLCTEECCNEKEGFFYCIPPRDYSCFIAWLVNQLTSRNASIVSQHPSLRNPKPNILQNLVDNNTLKYSEMLETKLDPQTFRVNRERHVLFHELDKASSLITSNVSGVGYLVCLFDSCSPVSLLIVNKCWSLAKHIVTSEAFSRLPSKSQSELLTEFLVSSCLIRGVGFTSFLLTRGARPSAKCLEVLCSPIVKENVELMKLIEQWDFRADYRLFVLEALYGKPHILRMLLYPLCDMKAALDVLLAKVLVEMFIAKADRRFVWDIYKSRKQQSPDDCTETDNVTFLDYFYKTYPWPKSTDWYSFTPLHYAAIDGEVDVTNVLDYLQSTDRLQQEINVQTKMGLTALDLAAANGRPSVMEALLVSGAAIGQCTLHMAAAGVSSPKDLERMKMDVDENERKSILEKWIEALTIGWEDTKPPGEVSDYVSVINLLLRHGAEINQLNEDVRTPLYYAEKYGPASVVQLLKQHSAGREAVTDQKPGGAPGWRS